MFLCKEFSPLCDKQVIAIALGQFRINFTRIFKVFQIAQACFQKIALVASRLGNLKNFENTLEINP